MPSKDPCKHIACEIQKCLQASSYQESACQIVIQQMLHCCKQWEHLHTVSCSGFSLKSKEDKVAKDKNKDPILGILKKYFPYEKNKESHLFCLEISSGTGQHVAHFAKGLPFMTFQPSEFTLSNLPSIKGYVAEAGLENVLSPLAIDVTDAIDSWNLPRKHFDLILNINMMHISPWECTLALFEKSGQLLNSKGLLITYGPYAHHGVITPESNVCFDQSLKSRDARWGLREIDELQSVANRHRLELMEIEEMPSNNKSLIWKKF